MAIYSKLSGNISIHKNCLISKSNTVAYYIMTPYNYSIMSYPSIEKHVKKLTNNFSILAQSYSEIEFSIFNVSINISKSQVIKKLAETARRYQPNFTASENLKKTINPVLNSYTILAVNLDEKNSLDVFSNTTGKVIKQLSMEAIKKLSGIGSTSLSDIDKIDSVLLKLNKILNRIAVPVPSDLVVDIFAKQVYPLYQINNSILTPDVLSYMTQEFKPFLGSFEMSNSGVANFGFKPEKSYCSILNILDIPEYVNNDGFGIRIDGMRVDCRTTSKERALLKMRRVRSDIEEEEKEAIIANAKDSDISEKKDLADMAVKRIKSGYTVVDLNVSIFVTSFDKDIMERKRQNVISKMKDRDVICNISGKQAYEYLNNFVFNKPGNYNLFTELGYAMSFQMNALSMAGDYDSKFYAPSIGETI